MKYIQLIINKITYVIYNMDFSDIAGKSYEKNIDSDIIDTNELFKGQLIRIDETPTDLNWKFVPLFLEEIQGDTYVWQIGFDNDISKLITICGTLITSESDEDLNTSYHALKINEDNTNIQKQALLDARRMYLAKYDEGYFPSGEELPIELNGVKPMLAKKYRHPSFDTVNLKLESNEARIKNFPVSVMRKINGIRALSNLRENKITIRSQLNNLYPHLNHIKSELEIFLRYLPTNCELDGELYSLKLSFKDLKTSVGQVNGNEIKYWVYDIIDPQRMIWENRYKMLVNAYVKYLEDGNTSNNFRIMQAYNANSHHDIDKYYNQFITEGYNGLNIRRYGYVEKDQKLAQYRPNKTASLIEYKHFYDEDVIIIGYESEKEFTVEDKKGNNYPVKSKNIVGQNIVGKELTIRYQEKSVKGVPKFPVAICLK